jgi:predicted PolB exonuclease-like 3'-5' exonuclease
LLDSGYTLCWAAKWFEDKDIQFESILHGAKGMLRKVHKLLDEADVVVHYNGTRFDIPTLNKEFLKYDMSPPAPYAQVDLLRTARSQFRFASNKLDYVAEFLGFGGKVKTKGHQLWKGCMEGDADSWQEMEEYNKHDVKLLEDVYIRMLPWIKNHPNHNVYKEDGESLCCTHCGGYHYQRRGWYYTQSTKYRRFQCLDCFRWFRTAVSEGPASSEKFVKAA